MKQTGCVMIFFRDALSKVKQMEVGEWVLESDLYGQEYQRHEGICRLCADAQGNMSLQIRQHQKVWDERYEAQSKPWNRTSTSDGISDSTRLQIIRLDHLGFPQYSIILLPSRFLQAIHPQHLAPPSVSKEPQPEPELEPKEESPELDSESTQDEILHAPPQQTEAESQALTDAAMKDLSRLEDLLTKARQMHREFHVELTKTQATFWDEHGHFKGLAIQIRALDELIPTLKKDAQKQLLMFRGELAKALQGFGIAEFRPQRGERLDPLKHEATGTRTAASVNSCVACGFERRDPTDSGNWKVLVKAKVE